MVLGRERRIKNSERASSRQKLSYLAVMKAEVGEAGCSCDWKYFKSHAEKFQFYLWLYVCMYAVYVCCVSVFGARVWCVYANVSVCRGDPAEARGPPPLVSTICF